MDPKEWAKPLHQQQFDKYLRLDPFLNYVENILTSKDEPVPSSSSHFDDHDYLPVHIQAQLRKRDEELLNCSKSEKDRKWLKNILLSDSSSDDDCEELTRGDLHELLVQHIAEKRLLAAANGKKQRQFLYLSSGILSVQDRYEEKPLLTSSNKKRKYERRIKERDRSSDESETEEETKEYATFRSLVIPLNKGLVGRPSKKKNLTEEQLSLKRHKLWVAIAKKEIPKAQKIKSNVQKDKMLLLKKVAKEAQKEYRKTALASQKLARDAPTRARRLCKEMQVYWKRFEKVEREHRKKAEKEAHEQRRQDLETLEMKRQQRKLNFLITQTELYAHFMARKMTHDSEEGSTQDILKHLDEDSTSQVADKNGLVDLVGDSYNPAEAQKKVLANARAALDAQQRHQQQFDEGLANPSISTDAERPQPALLEGKLTEYQLKGMNWLINLYEQGINGILADEMGLGKTIQSIAFMGHLAESYSIWGPFLVVAPASTLHNWQQELARFLPQFKSVPYWGNTQDRKILRKFWNQTGTCTQESSFHLVVTSYQIVLQDIKYFSRIKWHYMILDEAQAIKSTSSARWKTLLGFNCRNRLLLTGTPIQNTMQELWALLHFIMPTLFDSHEEFSEWFSKDIESSVERQAAVDERHLSRLHMILKPFMLRRLKKDVQDELSDKIEKLIDCPLTRRQKLLYQAVKNKIRIEDLLQTGGTSTSGTSQTSSLMNLVMQFRKVCNHPELFERRDIRSPFFMRLAPYLMAKLVYREGLLGSSLPCRDHLLYNMLYIHSPSYVHSTYTDLDTTKGNLRKSCFSFLRFVKKSPADWNSLMFKGLLWRWLDILYWSSIAGQIHHYHTWSEHQPAHSDFLLTPTQTTYFTNVQSSPCLQELIFSSPTTTVCSHLSWQLHRMPETASHRRIRLRHHLQTSPQHFTGSLSPNAGQGGSHRLPSLSPPHSTTPGGSPTHRNHRGRHHSHPFVYSCTVLQNMPTSLPTFLYHNLQKVHAGPMETYCSDRSASYQHLSASVCGQVNNLRCLEYGSLQLYREYLERKSTFFPRPPQGLAAVQPYFGFSGVYVPNKETLITDAGKLYILDSLLAKLKADGHRVLIYSQMTRMIDILEEYMWYRRHTYMRLDGSSKISDRRDMVEDFQTRSDIFVFLLSTRAGGLGINLTAADTVIFYDSDWNPTVDQQAMDRAHRLGQTKQVTVYRLICKGTIEERILQRAREKSEIQKMVISGGSYRPDVLRPKEVVSLLLDDDEMESKFRMKEAETTVKRPNAGFLGMSLKRKAEKSGRRPGRPKKMKPDDVPPLLASPEHNVTITEVAQPCTSTPIASGDTLGTPVTFYTPGIEDSSMDSPSIAPSSPISLCSHGSEAAPINIADDSEVSLLVDDIASLSSQLSNPNAGSGKRPRGRPRGSVGRRPRGRGSIQKALSAAEAAAMQAGKSAGYAAYGYSLSGSDMNMSAPSTSPTPATLFTATRGFKRGRGRRKQNLM